MESSPRSDDISTKPTSDEEESKQYQISDNMDRNKIVEEKQRELIRAHDTEQSMTALEESSEQIDTTSPQTRQLIRQQTYEGKQQVQFDETLDDKVRMQRAVDA